MFKKQTISNEMNKKIITIIIVLLIITGGWYFFSTKNNSELPITSPLDTTYSINGESFEFINGIAEKTNPYSEIPRKISVFEEPIIGDIDEDGNEDASVILTENKDENTDLYYVAITANTKGQYKGTNTIFLGENIDLKTFKIEEGRVKIKYTADKIPTANYLHLQFNPKNLDLIEVAVDFTNEINPETTATSTEPLLSESLDKNSN